MMVLGELKEAVSNKQKHFYAHSVAPFIAICIHFLERDLFKISSGLCSFGGYCMVSLLSRYLSKMAWVRTICLCYKFKYSLFPSAQVWHHLPHLLIKPVKRTFSKYHSKPSCLQLLQPWRARRPSWAMEALALFHSVAPAGRAMRSLSCMPSWARHLLSCLWET